MRPMSLRGQRLILWACVVLPALIIFAGMSCNHCVPDEARYVIMMAAGALAGHSLAKLHNLSRSELASKPVIEHETDWLPEPFRHPQLQAQEPPASACDYDPRTCPGEVGMHHCPECGDMVMAGMEHPNYELGNKILGQLGSLRFGDLVVTDEGYFALVVDPVPLRDDGPVELYLGNGLNVFVDWHRLTPISLPESTALANFAEWMVIRP